LNSTPENDWNIINLEELYSKYGTRVYRWVLFFGIDTAGAEEVTQEVFITAMKKLDSVQSQEVLSSWLFQIARKHAANYRRSAWVRKVFRNKKDIDDTLYANEHNNGAEHNQRSEKNIETRRILGRMPMRLVEILIMHDMDGYTRDEISTALNMPPGTVASRLRTARTMFAKNWNGSVNDG
jgi:RNA polymerase sigma-70 factor (ECF subfamily)